jgi:2'-5' RNA ligase
MHPAQSALIVAVPEAEPAVAGLRARYDPSAAWGVPAHVTLLYPFLPPAAITVDVLSTIQQIVWATPRFQLTLTKVAWFGDKVVWLTPQPDQPLRTLTAALSKTFRLQPYAGEHRDVIPHLTVADQQPLATLRRAATEVQHHLPIRAAVTTVRLITGRPEPGRPWQTVSEFTLG